MSFLLIIIIITILDLVLLGVQDGQSCLGVIRLYSRRKTVRTDGTPFAATLIRTRSTTVFVESLDLFWLPL